MEKGTVINKLIALYNEMFAISIDASLVNKHLLGSLFKITPRDLVYFFLAIEKEFNVKISEEHIGDGAFCTLDNIANILVSLKYEQQC